MAIFVLLVADVADVADVAVVAFPDSAPVKVVAYTLANLKELAPNL